MDGLLPPKWLKGLRWLIHEHLFETVSVSMLVLVGLYALKSYRNSWRARL